jgi:predicted nucleic acid-binding protein
VSLVYLDSSALVKLVVREPESVALLTFLREHGERASSTLALTEVPRALRRAGFGRVEGRRARTVLGGVALVDADRRILSAAAALEPPTLRTLDAIHLATALTFGGDLAALVTYDRRLTEAAERAQVEVAAPA